MNHNFNPKAAVSAQEAYCDEHEQPMFTPYDGQCPRCGRSIFLPTNGPHGMVYGYSVEYAENHLITGCPHCNYSFVE